MRIISHEHPLYAGRAGPHQNGAYWYSKEIVENIIPEIRTDRSWVTINVPGVAANHSIVFIHNNKNPAMYDHLQGFRDLVLVCGVPSTCAKVAHLGKALYLPLSVDVGYVERFKTECKPIAYAYVGRKGKREGIKFPKGTIYIENLPRPEMLKMLAQCNKVFAVGRCALEAKILGCEVLPYDPRFPDPDFWQVLDNREAAKILQAKLNEIDKEKK